MAAVRSFRSSFVVRCLKISSPRTTLFRWDYRKQSREEGPGRKIGKEARRDRASEDMFLAAEIPEGADVGDDEGGGEAVFGADRAEVDAAVFESEAAAATVVADLDELALEGLVGEIVADSGGEIET